MEEAYEFNGRMYQAGYTRDYVRVAVPGETALTNKLIWVKAERMLDKETVCGRTGTLPV